VSGFPKDQRSNRNQHRRGQAAAAAATAPSQPAHYSIDNILKGQIGDDAYFVATHVDDWPRSNSSSTISGNTSEDSNDSPEPINSPALRGQNRQTPLPREPQQDVPFSGGYDVLGVADGVGGWRQYGVDPGQFSRQLMLNCERLARTAASSATNGGGSASRMAPATLLAQSFREMQEAKRSVIGSSTACVMVLSHAERVLRPANIGDSGFLVVRGNEVVHR